MFFRHGHYNYVHVYVRRQWKESGSRDRIEEEEEHGFVVVCARRKLPWLIGDWSTELEGS